MSGYVGEVKKGTLFAAPHAVPVEPHSEAALAQLRLHFVRLLRLLFVDDGGGQYLGIVLFLFVFFPPLFNFRCRICCEYGVFRQGARLGGSDRNGQFVLCLLFSCCPALCKAMVFRRNSHQRRHVVVADQASRNLSCQILQQSEVVLETANGNPVVC